MLPRQETHPREQQEAGRGVCLSAASQGGFWDRPGIVDALCATNDLISCPAPEFGS